MTQKILQVPYGTRDFLPGEAKAKKIIENSLMKIFDIWGYAQVETPTLEYLDTFAVAGQASADNFQFFDRDNRILTMRSDMTTPLARMVATRLPEASLQRLFYLSQVFRHEEAQAGRQCEFTQAGIEMMGASGASADAEVVALAIKALQETGLPNFTISMGHIKFIEGLAEEARFTVEQTLALKRCLITHNAVELDNLLAATKVEGKIASVLRRLLFLHGGVELLQEMQGVVDNAKSRNALQNLLTIYSLCESYGVASYISFDLSLLRSFDYYTGMIFEGYTPGMGYSICGGGRYDSMMASFGRECPATGFSLGIDRIMLALKRNTSVDNKAEFAYLVAYSEGKLNEAIAAAMELRTQGVSAKLAEQALEQDEAEDALATNDCCRCLYIGK